MPSRVTTSTVTGKRRTVACDAVDEKRTASRRNLMAKGKNPGLRAVRHKLHGHVFQAVHDNRAEPTRLAVWLDPERSVDELLV